MRAIFYIDGFNFYYLRTRKQPQHKWLDMKQLADRLVPQGTVVTRVNYYTAPVSGKVDSDAPRRQQLLLSALGTCSEVSVFKGRFLYSEKWAGLVKPARAKPDGYVWAAPEPETVYIKKTEEKGSDVNLGVHLVRDGFTDQFDVAYVLTNDTDLVEPIRIVAQEIKKPVVMVAPCRPFLQKGRMVPVPAPSLAAFAAHVVYIDDQDLAASQFPNPLLRKGKKPLNKPPAWV